MFLFEVRASTVLYHFLRSNPSPFPYLLPANSCPIIPATFMKARQSFILVDISPTTFCLDESKTLQILDVNKNKIAGIVMIHSYGETSTHVAFFSIIKSRHPNMVVIDDRCLCEPDFSEPDLSSSDLVLFSTGYGKYLDIGMGGFGWLKEGFSYQKNSFPFSPQAAFKMDADLKCVVQSVATFIYQDSAWLDTGPVPISFEDYRSKVQTEIAVIKQKKYQINKIYTEGLPKEIQFPLEINQWRFNIKVSNKIDLLNSLFKNGLFASSHYASLGGIMSADKFPVAENIHSRIINLFNDRYYSIDQARRTVNILNSILTRGSKS